MSAKTYEITSQEGLELFQRMFPDKMDTEMGASVELDLEDNQERALIAAGWLSEPAKKKKEG